MSTNYYPLVNKVLDFLNVKERVASKSAELLHDSSFIKPFITVAREPGSGGAPIAKRVAEKLNFEFIDEQIIDEISQSTKRRKAIIEEIDEKSRTKIADMVHSIMNIEYVDDATYVSELIRVVLTYAYKGKTVILGRGANFYTPFGKGLHVNVVAPYEVRVHRAMDFEGHSREKAKEVISEVDKERRSFVKQYFRKDIDKNNSYDLTINTTHFRVEEAADVIVEAFKKKFGRSFPIIGRL
jgi:cytidylate kinase